MKCLAFIERKDTQRTIYPNRSSKKWKYSIQCGCRVFEHRLVEDNLRTIDCFEGTAFVSMLLVAHDQFLFSFYLLIIALILKLRTFALKHTNIWHRHKRSEKKNNETTITIKLKANNNKDGNEKQIVSIWSAPN